MMLNWAETNLCQLVCIHISFKWDFCSYKSDIKFFKRTSRILFRMKNPCLNEHIHIILNEKNVQVMIIDYFITALSCGSWPYFSFISNSELSESLPATFGPIVQWKPNCQVFFKSGNTLFVFHFYSMASFTLGFEKNQCLPDLGRGFNEYHFVRFGSEFMLTSNEVFRFG